MAECPFSCGRAALAELQFGQAPRTPMVMVSKFSNFSDELSKNYELREYELIKYCTNDDEHSNVESSLQSSNLLYVT